MSGVPPLHYPTATSHVAREGYEVKTDRLAPLEEADSLSTKGVCSDLRHVRSQSLPGQMPQRRQRCRRGPFVD